MPSPPLAGDARTMLPSPLWGRCPKGRGGSLVREAPLGTAALSASLRSRLSRGERQSRKVLSASPRSASLSRGETQGRKALSASLRSRVSPAGRDDVVLAALAHLSCSPFRGDAGAMLPSPLWGRCPKGRGGSRDVEASVERRSRTATPPQWRHDRDRTKTRRHRGRRSDPRLRVGAPDELGSRRRGTSDVPRSLRRSAPYRRRHHRVRHMEAVHGEAALALHRRCGRAGGPHRRCGVALPVRGDRRRARRARGICDGDGHGIRHEDHPRPGRWPGLRRLGLLPGSAS